MPATLAKPRRAKRAASAPKAGSAGPFATRLKRIAKLAAEAGCPHLLITNPLDVGYLTGFLGGDSYLLLGGRKPVILSDRRYEEELESVRSLCDIVMRTNQSLIEAVAKCLADSSASKLGIQAEHLTLSGRQQLSAKCKGVKLAETVGLVGKLRIVKDATEVALIRRANEIGEEALEATLPEIERELRKNGAVSEAEIAAILEHHMKSRGSSVPSFESIVAAGANGSHPHYRPGMVNYKRNQPLLIDWGATYRGYHGDMTRCFCFGKWPAKMAEVYKLVLEAHQLAAAALAPGENGREIDSVARDFLTRHGYGHQFAHSLGHGIGLNIHEAPRLAQPGEPDVLVPGHIVTIEPGVYLPGVGGIRIEDNYLITTRGAENLCSLPKTLEWATR